ncbi:hypothetical protein GQ457_17G014440 [Hibiscus cannabinus]
MLRKLYLPLFFQIKDLIPTYSSNVEQFLSVVDVMKRRNYVFDSLGSNDERKSIALDLLIEVPSMFGCHPHLGRLFKDVIESKINYLELPKHPNSHIM